MSTRPTMRALIFEGPGRMSLRDIPRPEPGPGEVLIRIYTAAICGTDVRIVEGRKTRDVRIGHPIGHECSGWVAALGNGVREYVIGQRVAICVVVSCGECRFCRSDHENLCETRITLGYHTDGAFAEYMLIPAHAVARGNIFKLPPEIDMSLAPLIEPMACCINGQHEMGLHDRESNDESERSRSLVVFGAGPIGLMHLLLSKRGGRPSEHGPANESAVIGPVTVVEPREHRRRLALDFGADQVCSPDEFVADGRFDAAILAVGVPDLVPVALNAVNKSGRVSLFAGFDKDARVTIDPNLIHYSQIRVAGASESRRRDYAEAMQLMASGHVDPGPLLTHRFELDRHREAFDLAGRGEVLKVAFRLASDDVVV